MLLSVYSCWYNRTKVLFRCGNGQYYNFSWFKVLHGHFQHLPSLWGNLKRSLSCLLSKLILGHIPLQLRGSSDEMTGPIDIFSYEQASSSFHSECKTLSLGKLNFHITGYRKLNLDKMPIKTAADNFDIFLHFQGIKEKNIPSFSCNNLNTWA